MECQAHKKAKTSGKHLKKRFPLSGEGVVSANLKRSKAFRIRIKPADDKDDKADEKGYVEVEISPSQAMLKAKSPSREIELGPCTTPSGGLEKGEKVSYWFSFNRDERILKYGKGYIMEETTLITKKFPPETNPDDPWEFLFSPDKAKEIVIREVDGNDEPQDEMDHQAPQAYRLTCQDEISLVDLEKSVSFYPHPMTVNWPPLVLDSSKATLDTLSKDRFMFSASLPAICRELYENAAGITLVWPYEKVAKFSDVINYSLSTEGKILHEKCKEKKEKGEFEYLRVNVGTDHGCSPGIPYELEIWPPGAQSPIHSHGNAYAVEKVLYGEIKFTIYNKTWREDETQEELMSFKATQGDISWMSPNWYQTHRLKNESNELFCATLQCYKYGEDDERTWPYFDFLDKEKGVMNFPPKGDFESLEELQKELLSEYPSDNLDS